MSSSSSSSGNQRIGAFLCWGVVFADIGSSVYYVPGILYGDVGRPAAAFVLLTGLCVLLLARKYVTITARYVDGGGVVSAASEAFGPLIGALGGMLISVGYFLTSAISAVSAFEYVSSVVDIADFKLALTCAALLALGLLNIIGIKESAAVSAVMAVMAFAAASVTAVLAAMQMQPGDFTRVLDNASSVTSMSPMMLLEGYAGAWLAFSGLESMSQLSPALKDPKYSVAKTAMIAVTASILLTSPILTAFSVTLLDVGKTNPNHFISELGFFAGGQPLRIAVVVTASMLLLFASNTAIIGCYHVFVAVSRERFLPASFARIHPKFGTPVQAIWLAVGVPVIIIALARGSLSMLGHLYAFGVLGAFTLSALSMDVVAWREGRRRFAFVVGVFTTFTVAVGWAAHAIFKIESTFFAGGLTALGMGLAISVKKGWLRGEMNLIPFMTAEAAESAAEQTPAMRKILSLQEALDILPVYPGGLLVPVRGFRPALLDAAIELARQRGFNAIQLLYVDEIPGLYYPPKVGPSGDAIRTLALSTHYLENRGVSALPVWRMAHDAASSIASAARKLSTKVVMLGASERNPLWTVLRGSVLRGLSDKLDKAIELAVADTSRPSAPSRA